MPHPDGSLEPGRKCVKASFDRGLRVRIQTTYPDDFEWIEILTIHKKPLIWVDGLDNAMV